MLYRKILSYIDDHLKSKEDKILLFEGTRQIGKSYIIRDVGTEFYANYDLGSVYESAIAQELKAHYEKLFYYDNKQKGEVDFLVDDGDTMSVLPVEVKSGKDYTVHSALDNLMVIQDYRIVSSIVIPNEREIQIKENILYLPIYNVMFLENKIHEKETCTFRFNSN